MTSAAFSRVINDSAIEACCERIAQQLNIAVAANIDAYAQLRAACTAVNWWNYADRHGLNIKEKRIRRQRFFVFVARAYEIATEYRAGLTWDRASGSVKGEFFSMAKLCESLLLPIDMCADNDIALGKVIDRALKRRTSDRMPKRRAGRRPANRCIT